MNLLKENFFKKVLTNKEKCDIIYIVKGKEIPYRKELIKNERHTDNSYK